MATDTTITTIVDGILAWCGVDDPTSAEMSVAEMAAENAVGTIRHYRGLSEDEEMAKEYIPLAIEMGVYLFQKRGVDGTTQFTEGGVQRTFESGSFPPSMLSRITLATRVG